MKHYPEAAMEGAMKIQEVILRAEEAVGTVRLQRAVRLATRGWNRARAYDGYLASGEYRQTGVALLNLGDDTTSQLEFWGECFQSKKCARFTRA